MSDTGLPGAARQISIQLTSDDLAHANMLHFLRNMRRPRTIMRLTASWLVGITFIVLLISLIDWRLPRLGPFFTIYLLSILAGLFVLPFLYMLAFNGRVSRKRFARYRPLQVPRVADWSEIGLNNSNEFGTVRMPWQEFVRLEENGSYLLIYTAEYFIIIPKRCLTETQLNDLRQCMRIGNPALAK